MQSLEFQSLSNLPSITRVRNGSKGAVQFILPFNVQQAMKQAIIGVYRQRCRRATKSNLHPGNDLAYDARISADRNL